MFSNFIQSALPPTPLVASKVALEPTVQIIASGLGLLGIGLAWVFFRKAPAFTERLMRSRPGAVLYHFWYHGWGFDLLYDLLLVRPYIFLARIDRRDIVDRFYDLLAKLAAIACRWASASQTGRLRTYAAGLTFGAIAVIAIMVWL